MQYTFCPHCGDRLQEALVGSRPRSYCSSCDRIFYRNPTVGVAGVLLDAEKLLLVKRVGSYAGRWCIPCGHVEWGEDIRSAARREFREETGLDVAVGAVLAVHSNFHDPERQTVGVWFRVRRNGGRLIPGSDAAEARFFSLDRLPDPMAFPTDLLVCDQIRRSLRP
jgi:ADP-ribose pyrophosphatase YjhB (NUDIX family)